MAKPELIVAPGITPNAIHANVCRVETFIPKAGPLDAGEWCEGGNPLSHSPDATAEELIEVVLHRILMEENAAGVSTRILFGQKGHYHMVAYQE